MTRGRKAKVYIRSIPEEPFERMKIIARANGFPLKSEDDVFRICWLADTFRGVYKIGAMRSDLQRRKPS